MNSKHLYGVPEIPPRWLTRWYQHILDEVLKERAVSRRGRHVPRGVRRRGMYKYPTRQRGPSTLAKGIDYQEAVEVLA